MLLTEQEAGMGWDAPPPSQRTLMGLFSDIVCVHGCLCVDTKLMLGVFLDFHFIQGESSPSPELTSPTATVSQPATVTPSSSLL